MSEVCRTYAPRGVCGKASLPLMMVCEEHATRDALAMCIHNLSATLKTVAGDLRILLCSEERIPPNAEAIRAGLYALARKCHNDGLEEAARTAPTKRENARIRALISEMASKR